MDKKEEDFVNQAIGAYEICRKLLCKKIDINTTEEEKLTIIHATVSSSVNMAKINISK